MEFASVRVLNEFFKQDSRDNSLCDIKIMPSLIINHANTIRKIIRFIIMIILIFLHLLQKCDIFSTAVHHHKFSVNRRNYVYRRENLR